MDRFVVREPRIGADFPQGNHMVGFGLNSPRNNNMMPPENMYLGGYSGDYSIHQPTIAPGYFGVHQQMSSTNFSPQAMNFHPGQPQMMSGIDPRYLASYSDGQAQFIATGQNIRMQKELRSMPANFGDDYENRSFSAPERNKPKTTAPHVPSALLDPKQHEHNMNEKTIYKTVTKKEPPGLAFQSHPVSNVQKNYEPKTIKEEPETKIISRADKLKALHKSGTRVFTGPVEKVLKWHKSLQEIGVMVIYEVVAKCVSVRPGESCAKNLVVRDDSGPAMQVVYYEIDFLLPELKPPCTVRVVGRMTAGTCRLQAFSVRPATGDDMATLPRRAAVAAHHVAKLAKEYGIQMQ